VTLARSGLRKPDIPVAAASGSWAVRACRPDFQFTMHIGRTAIDYDVNHFDVGIGASLGQSAEYIVLKADGAWLIALSQVCLNVVSSPC
jgi:hypothetical protein